MGSMIAESEKLAMASLYPKPLKPLGYRTVSSQSRLIAVRSSPRESPTLLVLSILIREGSLEACR